MRGEKKNRGMTERRRRKADVAEEAAVTEAAVSFFVFCSKRDEWKEEEHASLWQLTAKRPTMMRTMTIMLSDGGDRASGVAESPSFAGVDGGNDDVANSVSETHAEWEWGESVVMTIADGRSFVHGQ